MPLTTGWIKDKYDRRDLLHATRIETLDPQHSLKQYIPPRRNQGSVGACAGFSFAEQVAAIAKRMGLDSEDRSPTWIYNGARFIMGTLNQDSGARPSDCLSWMDHNGILLEHFWPYDPTKLDMSAPSSARMAQAVKYTDFSYYRCVDGVLGICTAIQADNFVSLGMPWPDKWFDSPAEGILPEISVDDPVHNGHEVLVYEFDLVKSLVWLENSWGNDWGADGLFAIPFQAFDVLKQWGGYDAQYIKFTAIPAQPTPPPVKKCWIFS